MSSLPRQALESWVKSLKIKADKVLDVGGAQKPVKGRTGEWNVREYLISDIEEPHDNSPEPDWMFDLSKSVPIIREFQNYTDYFDAIFCLEVMEYVSDPVQAIKNLNELTKKGGKLYISFNFSYATHNPPGLDYFRYTRFGVEQLLENNGFKILSLIPRTCEMNTGYPELMQFYSKQGMKYTKDCGNVHSETGHLVVAEKI